MAGTVVLAETRFLTPFLSRVIALRQNLSRSAFRCLFAIGHFLKSSWPQLGDSYSETKDGIHGTDTFLL